MDSDYLRDLELLGVTARLKRLSDALSASIKELYGASDVDIEPSWHLVLLFLKDRDATPTEIASTLNLSQPAVTEMIKRMVGRGYLDVLPDESDGRKKIVRLTTTARERLPAFERIWAAGEAAIREILGEGTAFLGHLDAFEDEVGRRDFAERALEHLGGHGEHR